ncbi:MAG TPA: metallophosphoesterase family protein [Chloroflexota bacterium]|nr:metallophosphoesterase family protein [Chloroflexota bacterium]
MRCAILSDVHGNLDALEAVLADAMQLGAVEELWCLGDLVGYGPQPNECVALLRERGAKCVAGNHDWAAIGKMDTADFNPEATEAALWTGQQLSEENRVYLDALPAQLLAGAASEFTLVHGSPREPIWEYLTHVSVARLNFDYFHTPYCLVGHTHVPLVFQRPQASEKVPQYRTLVPTTTAPVRLGAHRLIVNPGSVGQPRDGNPHAAYMVYDSTAEGGDGAGTLTMRRVEYPVAAVQEKMRAAQLPSRLILRLTYGW